MKYRLKPRPVPEKLVRELDEEQLNAVVNSRGRSIVIAGPGSGKTRVITHKIIHLLSQGIDPSRILLMTFTRAAAREMIERARKATGKDLSTMIAGTFHSVGNHFLRRYAKFVGYSNDYTILDREDSYDLMEHVRDSVVEKYSMKKGILKPKNLVDVYSYMVNTKTDLERAVREKYPSLILYRGILEEIFEEYERAKIRNNVMDYDDLLRNFLKVLEVDEISLKLSERFVWILVDEFQDTNLIQYEIIEKLSRVHGNVLVVGDDAQSIYSFRGARYENVEDFMSVPGTLVFKIQTNYRSTERIVDLINALIPRRSVPKVLRAVRGDGEKPVLVKTLDNFDEAAFVAQRVEELLEEGFEKSDIVILYRSHYQSADVEVQLAKHRIPYRILSGLRFIERAHVKDVLAFLKIIQNPRDLVSWVRVAKLFPGVGDKTASGLAEHMAENYDPGKGLVETLKGFKSKRKSGVGDLIHVIETLVEFEEPSEIIETLLNVFYVDSLKARFPDHENRLEDLERLKELASYYDSVEKFLSDVLTSEDLEENGGNTVTLTTIHQAKGLEWKVVFVIGVVPGEFPNVKAVLDGKLDEEERLFYVAVTRAKDLLYIVTRKFTRRYSRYDRISDDLVSRIPEDLVDVWEVF